MGTRFADRKVIITGAAGVYGREPTLAFAGEGAKLCLVDHDRTALDRFAATLALPAQQLLIAYTDLTDETAIPTLAATVE